MRRVSGRKYLKKQLVSFKATTGTPKNRMEEELHAYSKASIIVRSGRYEQMIEVRSSNCYYKDNDSFRDAFRVSAKEMLWKLHSLGIHKRTLDRCRRHVHRHSTSTN